jgi:hypothetical protein
MKSSIKLYEKDTACQLYALGKSVLRRKKNLRVPFSSSYFNSADEKIVFFFETKWKPVQTIFHHNFEEINTPDFLVCSISHYGLNDLGIEFNS